MKLVHSSVVRVRKQQEQALVKRGTLEDVDDLLSFFFFFSFSFESEKKIASQ